MKTLLGREEIAAALDQVVRLRSDQYKNLNPEFDNDGELLKTIAWATHDSKHGVQYVHAIAQELEVNVPEAGTIFNDGMLVGMKIMEMIYGKGSN